jgi:hypothetical protein
VKLLSVGFVALLLLAGRQDARYGPWPPSPAIPLVPIAAIVDALRHHRVVGIGDAHGNRLGEAFQLALVRDPAFRARVDDVLVESGNSRHQDLADRFVRGETVAPEQLRQIWLDTTQQQAVSLQVPELFNAVRALNLAAPPQGRRLRILLGEPPIDWARIQTPEDYAAWEARPDSDRDDFAAGVLRREVLAKNRRAVAFYGAGHFFRKVVHHSLTTILEQSEPKTKVFTVWTNAAFEMASAQPDVERWPAPSLAIVRGTPLGKTGLKDYLGPRAGDVPAEWLAPMEEQFDAVLYLGPLASITLDRPQPWRCDEPALAERVRRANLQRRGLGDRAKAQCVR